MTNAEPGSAGNGSSLAYGYGAIEPLLVNGKFMSLTATVTHTHTHSHTHIVTANATGNTNTHSEWVGLEGVRPRTTTHDQVFRTLSEAVRVVPHCERLNTRRMPISQSTNGLILFAPLLRSLRRFQIIIMFSNFWTATCVALDIELIYIELYICM